MDRVQQAKNDADNIVVPDIGNLSYDDAIKTLKQFEKSSDMINIRKKYPEFAFVISPGRPSKVVVLDKFRRIE